MARTEIGTRDRSLSAWRKHHTSLGLHDFFFHPMLLLLLLLLLLLMLLPLDEVLLLLLLLSLLLSLLQSPLLLKRSVGDVGKGAPWALSMVRASLGVV